MDTVSLEQYSLVERCLLRLDEYPLAAIWRVGVGLMIHPVYGAVYTKLWPMPFLLFFVAVLLALRIGPAFLRRFLPVSARVKEEWAQRRQLAKAFDSYQWQKLFWIGLGMGFHFLMLPSRLVIEGVVAAVCVVGGALGLTLWLRRKQTVAIPA